MARIARSPGSSAGIRAAVAGLILGGLSPAWGQLATGVAGAPQAATPQDTNFFGVVWDSLSGDVYAPGWYGLGGVEVPVTHPEPFDYQVLGGLMKVW